MSLVSTRSFRMPFSTDADGLNHGRKNPITEALNEAVANALVHAYYGNEAFVKIIVSDGEVCISNTGNMLIDKEVAIAGGISTSRNPTLMRIMSFVGATDRAGSDVEMIWDVRNDRLGILPELVESHGPAQAVLKLPTLPLASGPSYMSNGTVAYTDDQILTLVSHAPDGLDAIGLEAACPGISRRTAQKKLKLLFEARLLDRRKNGKSFTYYST